MTSEENFIDCECPHCGGPVSFPDHAIGTAQECPNCYETLIVPSPGNRLASKVPLPIVTPRLVLRRLGMGDWKDLLEFLGDETLFSFSDTAPQTEEQIVRWLEAESHVRLTTADATFCLAIEHQQERKVVGQCYWNYSDPLHLQVTAGVIVSRAFQRQGIATEAFSAALSFCFQGMGLHRVAAWSDSRNIAALRLCEKVGLRREGEFVKQRWVNGEWANTVWFARLREEHAPAPRG